MYYHLNGELCLIDSNAVVIDCGGVGYRLTVSANTLTAISQKIGEKVLLYTHLAVREDSIELYGFNTVREHSVFKNLISVSGVGPKVAISVLSTLTPEQFAAAVCSGDAKTLAKSKGLGLKGAERIILELKEKLTKEFGVSAPSAAPAVAAVSGRLSDAMNALLVLGYSKSEAGEALNGLDSSSMTLEALITAALRRLMK
jgi:Holliday junction DNA helicase RuvA